MIYCFWKTAYCVLSIKNFHASHQLSQKNDPLLAVGLLLLKSYSCFVRDVQKNAFMMNMSDIRTEAVHPVLCQHHCET